MALHAAERVRQRKLEEKQKEEELKQFMIYCGRPGLWGDWVRFQVEARKRRQQEAIDAEKAREKMMEIIGVGFRIGLQDMLFRVLKDLNF